MPGSELDTQKVDTGKGCAARSEVQRSEGPSGSGTHRFPDSSGELFSLHPGTECSEDISSCLSSKHSRGHCAEKTKGGQSAAKTQAGGQ